MTYDALIIGAGHNGLVAAAYLAARLAGAAPDAAARAGHDLAGLVVGHPGAIVPRQVMRRLHCVKGALS